MWFVDGKSTIGTITALVAEIVRGFALGTILTLCDLSKAYDYIDHGKLVCKMDKLGYRSLVSDFCVTIGGQ